MDPNHSLTARPKLDPSGLLALEGIGWAGDLNETRNGDNPHARYGPDESVSLLRTVLRHDGAVPSAGQ